MDYSDCNVSLRLTWSQAHSVILACEYARQEGIDNDFVLKNAILAIERSMERLQNVVINLDDWRQTK